MNSAFNSDVALCSAPDLVSTPRALPSPERLAAEAIVTARQSVASVFEDSLLMAALRKRGYDDDAITRGGELQTAAEAEFVRCQALRDELDQVTNEFEEAWTATRDDYVEFRGTIRSLFAPSECACLFSIRGQIAPQLTEFAAQATLSYSRALEIKVLERAGYDDAWLHSSLRSLQNLVELDTIIRRRTALVAQAAAARNRALEHFTNWVRALVQEARAATSLLQRPPA